MNCKCLSAITLAACLSTGATAHAQIRITEWMYNETPEFVEFTNVGLSPIDMTGWSFHDNSRAPGSASLTAFGTVAPNESVIITEDVEADFRTKWGLPGSV